MQIAYYLENVGKLIASRQAGGDLLEIKSKGISGVCGEREVLSDVGAQRSEELKPQTQVQERLQVAAKCWED